MRVLGGGVKGNKVIKKKGGGKIKVVLWYGNIILTVNFSERGL